MAAVDVQVTRQMRAPLPALWSVINDLRRLPEWLAFAAALEDVSASEATPGATYTVKPHHGYEPKTHWRVAEAEPPRRQVHTSEMPMLSGVTSTIELLDGPDGVRADVHWRGEPANLLGRLMRPMFQRRIEAQWEQSLKKLDALAGA